MRICKRENCYTRIEQHTKKQYCSDKCLKAVKYERDCALREAKKLAGTPDDPMRGKLFDCSLSLEWLMKPLRAA